MSDSIFQVALARAAASRLCRESLVVGHGVPDPDRVSQAAEKLRIAGDWYERFPWMHPDTMLDRPVLQFQFFDPRLVELPPTLAYDPDGNER